MSLCWDGEKVRTCVRVVKRHEMCWEGEKV